MLVVPGALALALLPDASRLAMRRTTPSETRSAAVSMAPTGAPKVVVTGVGVVSALGSGDEFWEALLAGESGVDTITAFDASKYPTTIGAECKNFDSKKWFKSPKTAKSTDRYTHLAVAASKMALEDSALDTEAIDKERFGVIVGSAFGGMETFEKMTLNNAAGKKVSPFTIPMLLGNTASGITAIEVGAMGPNFGVASACAAGSHALGEGQLPRSRPNPQTGSSSPDPPPPDLPQRFSCGMEGQIPDPMSDGRSPFTHPA
uniref:Nodulation protein E n=1 Tax=Haptolina ericina TaxID=156174 RepID=A0A7S3BRA0_9EUKA|mmetsp:Transcript_64411/g.143904  ORF Transcript_64411/g.143904 Transcript_64411/m.143904 type:complete len:261 (+) Transcript_64411:23-805(+)